MEAGPGTWCRASDWDCMIYEEASEVEGVAWVQQELDAGLSLFLGFKFEPESERDQACPALWLQGFRLLLKSWALARYHRPELNDCLVIGDATPTTALLEPTTTRHHGQSCYLSASESRFWGNTTPTQHFPRSSHLKFSDSHTFPSFMHLDFFTQPSYAHKALVPAES